MSRNAVLSVLVLVAAIGFFAIKVSTGKHLPTPDAQAEAGDLDSRALGAPDGAARPEELRHELEVDIPIASEFGSEADVKRRYELEDELSAELGDYGVVDGGDMGGGFMGIFVVDVSDLPRAVASVKAVLTRHGLLAAASVLHWEVNLDGEELSDATLVWPPTYEGVFARWFWPEATQCADTPAAQP